MDTGTHLVIGLGLAGLSQIDPSVSADTAATTAVFIGTVIGSQIPDVDGLLRFKGNATYIRNHRGRSHSLPALLLWTLLITGALALFSMESPCCILVCGLESPFAFMSSQIVSTHMAHKPSGHFLKSGCHGTLYTSLIPLSFQATSPRFSCGLSISRGQSWFSRLYTGLSPFITSGALWTITL